MESQFHLSLVVFLNLLLLHSFLLNLRVLLSLPPVTTMAQYII
jgi:hypothetical protein